MKEAISHIIKTVKWLETHWIKILLCINMLVVLALGIKCYAHVTNLYSISYSQEDLAGFTSEKGAACFGGKLDENSSAALYNLYPETMLRTGCYKYEVTYKSSSPESFGFPHSYITYYDGFDGDKVTDFTEEEATNSDIFWMNIDLDMTFRVWYDGTGELSFQSYSIQELPYGAYKELFFALLYLLLIDIIICLVFLRDKYPVKDSTKYLFFGMSVLLLVSWFPMLGGYMINGHDLDFHLVRIEGIKDALLCGQFPVRMNPDFYNGYGYANPIFYGEILLFIPAFLRMIGFTLTESYIALVGVINLLTILICYYSINGIVKNERVAFVGTVLYTLAPYRLVDIYTRAAIGEASAMIFLPLCIYGMYRMYRIYTDDAEQKSYQWSFIPLLIGLTGILQTHVLTGEMTAGFVILTCILLLPKTLQKKRFLALLKTAIFLVLINIWFLVPFIDFSLTQDLRVFARTKLDGPKFLQETGAYLVQLFYVFYRYAWKTFNSNDIISDEMPLALGLPLILGMVLCAAMAWSNGDKKKRIHAAFIVFLSFLATWMSTVYFPWDKLSTMHKLLATLITSLQFTWRFLGIASAFSAVAVCMGLCLLEEKNGKTYSCMIAAVLCSIALVSGMNYMQQCFDNQSPRYEDDIRGISTPGAASGGEYVPSKHDHYVVNNIFEPRPSENCIISDYVKNGTTITMHIENSSVDGHILLPLFHYKGYDASSDDGLISGDNLVTGEYEVIQLNIPPNYNGNVTISYQGMWYWRVAELMSAAAVIYLIAAYVYYKKCLKNK